MFIMFDHVSIKHNIKYTVGGVFFLLCVRVSTRHFLKPFGKSRAWGQAQAAEKTMREEQQKYQEERPT
jgi:hypothetical protein